MALSAGTRLGPYEVTALIGAGGMGEVYRARDTRLDRTVAIKVLPTDVAADPDRRRRFEQEARAVSALNHPHICVLFDVGEHVPSNPESRLPRRSQEEANRAEAGVPPASPKPDEQRSCEGGNPASVSYLVMEYLEGQTLAERLQQRKGGEASPLRVEEALEIGAQIADALSAAHKHGIVHRDLKPANIMLTKAGATGSGTLQAKLLDFGVARLTQVQKGTGESETVSGTSGHIVGTVPYMAPEQIEGREVDARTDLFAFGAVLYEMLTGTRAFEGTSPASVMAAVLEHEPPPISRTRPLTPPALDRLVRKCLAKDPDGRWDSAHDVADELRWMRETRAVGAPTGVQPRRRRGPANVPHGGGRPGGNANRCGCDVVAAAGPSAF
jgi:serine/threonine protein kinase